MLVALFIGSQAAPLALQPELLNAAESKSLRTGDAKISLIKTQAAAKLLGGQNSSMTSVFDALSTGLLGETSQFQRQIGTWITEKEGRVPTSITRCFKASIDGDSATMFHQKCNHFAHTIVVAKSAATGYIYGAYTDAPWSSHSGYTTNSSSTSFLWSATTNMKCDNKGSYINYNAAGYGPTFGGGHDLYINSGALSSTGSYTNPSSFSCGSNTALTGQYNGYTLTDYEVWAVEYEQLPEAASIWTKIAGDDALLSETNRFEQQIGKWITEKEGKLPLDITR